MAIWQLGLILLALVWLLQAAGTWVQMRHYRAVMGGISRQWSDGHLGAGTSRSALGKGVVLILVVGPDDIVRKLMVMEGRSVFARFEPREGFEGLQLAALRDLKPAPSGPKLAAARGFSRALAQAVEQIERARERASARAPSLAAA